MLGFRCVFAIVFSVCLTASSAWAGGETKKCEDTQILSSIKERFHRQSIAVRANTLHIAEIHNVHEHRSTPSSEVWPIARRYCGATLRLADGRSRDVWYLIESHAGLAGLGNNVEFCVSGFDDWYIYNASCRILR